MMNLGIGVISPQDWNLPAAAQLPLMRSNELGVSLAEIENRARNTTYEWLLRQFDTSAGAFYGHYRAPDGYREPPQTANLIAPWQLLAAYDRYGDAHLLDKAISAANWFYIHHVVDHPMSVVAGGARDGVATDEIWTKFTAEEIITCLGLYQRTQDGLWLQRALQSGRCLIQARRHGYAPRYSLSSGRWLEHGWDSWGRVVEANLLLWAATTDVRWLEEARLWGEHGLSIQAQNGTFHLIDADYYNTDLAADELRALVMLYEVTQQSAFLDAARRFADWHLDWQTEDGAWPLTIDREGNIVMPTVGPGDVPNIAVGLLRLYHTTGDNRYLASVCQALRYSLSVQITPESTHPYRDDEQVRWGFWSWQPPYDFTLSADQSTHHVRGMWFFVDYWQRFLSHNI